ncbi:chloride channel protein 2-like isoform X2 [Hylaeus volcanicus]|uniref:chloride channel protein 2-like isoform X2 n=1 Tax=Hylaeus volcanicus TaxID=313075 RepID=UPI0023B87A65|nr:chloride channel protein 2-like isoform X2 [Hylaeus volcanicus]
MASSNSEGSEDYGLGYQNTLMYGRYTKDLGEYAKEEARKLKHHEKARQKYDKTTAEGLRKSRRGPLCRKLLALLAFAWKHTGARLGEDWVFLALLGVIMALISYAMDRGISMCNNARIWLYQDLTHHPALQYLAWVALPVCLILFSAGFVHIVAPQSIGSGIPEMKTILRGVALKEYLTFRTLVAKGRLSPKISSPVFNSRNSIIKAFEIMKVLHTSMEILLASLSAVTYKQYESAWRQWWQFYVLSSEDFYRPTRNSLLRFLTYRFKNGIEKIVPPRPKYNFTWGVSVVLNYLRTLDPLSGLSLQDLTYKTVTLIAFCTAHRAQTLASIVT